MDWSWMTNYPLRVTIGGCILTIVGVILIAVLGFKAFYAGLLVVGIIALVAGLVWMAIERKRPQSEDEPKENE